MFQQSEKLKKKTCLIREAPTPNSVSLEASVSKVFILRFLKSLSALYFLFQIAVSSCSKSVVIGARMS